MFIRFTRFKLAMMCVVDTIATVLAIFGLCTLCNWGLFALPYAWVWVPVAVLTIDILSALRIYDLTH